MSWYDRCYGLKESVRTALAVRDQEETDQWLTEHVTRIHVGPWGSEDGTRKDWCLTMEDGDLLVSRRWDEPTLSLNLFRDDDMLQADLDDPGITEKVETWVRRMTGMRDCRVEVRQ